MNQKSDFKNCFLKILFLFCFIGLFVQHGIAQQKQNIRLILELNAAQKVNTNGTMVPVFEYDLGPEVKKSLVKAGYTISEKTQWNYDLVLTIEYTERVNRDDYFGDRIVVSLFKISLADAGNTILFIIQPYPVGETPKKEVKDYLINQLTGDIADRLVHEGEIHFLIDRYKKQLSSTDTLSYGSIASRTQNLVRMFELKDRLTERSFKEALLSPDPRQRWIGKFGLLELGIIPIYGSKFFIPFKMVNVLNFQNTIAPNYLRSSELLEKHKKEVISVSMRNFILIFSKSAIRLIIENIRCEKIMKVTHGRWYGGGYTSETNSDRVIKSLRKDIWEKRIPRFYKPSAEVIERWAWKSEYQIAALTIITHELEETHPDMHKASRLNYRQSLIDILSEIGDAKTIEFLQQYKIEHPILANDVDASTKIIRERI